MKCFLFTLLLSSILAIHCLSQGDTLVINLKNNQTDKIPVAQIQKIQFENITAIPERTNQSDEMELKGNFPNPFSDQTSIEFELASAGSVIIYIYDNSGNLIQELECGDCQAGNNSLQWNCLDKNNIRVQSGAYFYEVRFGSLVQSRKMILVK